MATHETAEEVAQLKDDILRLKDENDELRKLNNDLQHQVVIWQQWQEELMAKANLIKAGNQGSGGTGATGASLWPLRRY